MFEKLIIKNDIPVNYDSIELNFKDKKQYRSLILYGINGTGKTNISRSLSNNNIVDSEFYKKVSFKTVNNSDIEIDESKIFVFNEDYINDKFYFTKDQNLNAIVLNDEMMELDNKIRDLNIDFNKSNEFITSIDSKRETLNSSKKELDDLIKSNLRGDNSWAGIDATYKNFNKDKKNNSYVDERAIKQIISAGSSIHSLFIDTNGKKKNNYEQLKTNELKKFNEEFKLLEKEFNKLKYTEEIEEISIELSDLESKISVINKLLVNVMNNNKDLDISDIAKRINIIYEKYGMDHVKGSIKDLNEQLNQGDDTICPTCFNVIQEEYFQEIKNKVEHLLRKELGRAEFKQFLNELDKSKLQELDIQNNKEYMNFRLSYEKEIINFEELVVSYNSEIKHINDVIDKKKNIVYSELPIINSDYILSLSNKIKGEINTINNTIETHNEKYNNLKNLSDNIRLINNKITFINLYDSFYEYLLLIKELEDIEFMYSNKTSNYNKEISYREKIKDKIDELEIQKKNIYLAVKDINKKLNFILFDKGKLKVKVENDKYYVESNGSKVNLNRLSTGQRNIISLCYFFSHINHGKNYNEKYKDDILVVLDDPISSFDHNNRIGIMSLLRYEISRILFSNINSKVILMTHDMSVLYDFQKILSDIEEERKANEEKYSHIGSLKFKTFQIKNSCSECLLEFDADKTYKTLVNFIYKFANGNFRESEDKMASSTIGNTCRRVLEAYSTFNYNQGVNHLTNNEDILNRLGDKDLIEFYNNFMSRLILNSESHLEEKAKSETETQFMDAYTYEEKEKVARNTIHFLYSIDKLHIKKNIDSYDNIIEKNIEGWNPVKLIGE